MLLDPMPRQVCPASFVTAEPHQVTAYIVDGSDGAMASAAVGAPVNSGTGIHSAPPDVVLKSPWTVPAYAMDALAGSATSAHTSPERPAFARLHPPPSSLLNSPLTVAAYTVEPLSTIATTPSLSPVSTQVSPPSVLLNTPAGNEFDPKPTYTIDDEPGTTATEVAHPQIGKAVQ